MLPKKLQQIRVRIESKSDFLQTSEEREMLKELLELEKLIDKYDYFRSDLIKTATLLTENEVRRLGSSGTTCSCCGR